MPKNPDSMDKLYEYLENIHKSEYIYLSPSTFREFICHKFCGGCCTRFTLDYVVGSERYNNFLKQYPELISKFSIRQYKGIEVLTYKPTHSNYHCEFLFGKEALCSIHKVNPFTCNFEPIKVVSDANYTRKNISHTKIIRKKFGRGWNMLRVDNERGAFCEIEDDTRLSYSELEEFIVLLDELNYYYSLFFGSKDSRIDSIINLLIDSFYDILSIKSTNNILKDGVWFPETPKL